MGLSLQQFAMVAGAHLLALLSPGPDFFLIARSALLRGWRKTGAVCFGIACANGVFIALALGGVAALHRHGTAFALVQAAGCVYLFYLGGLMLRHARAASIGTHGQDRTSAPTASAWLARFATGFASAILNPKNALFYASLFALLAARDAPFGAQIVYGAWMFVAVFGWDLLVAMSIGHPAVVARFTRHSASIERVTGAVLLAIAASVLAMLARQWL
ncbi:LysE family transporter [Paraburkholderia phymatum]|uniref:Lysine exporter protein (LYSE/YGGA) n=1 Tax=Paraburkholderia phymatum (strain DSM 17167 / CIP 108236 / LMG 21445 / STM815) TaxID=391038 RepID=B2JCL9_PARP8|nr:LysE family transporter [Paraburkholderia phymatum]ACC71020.1 Lysine exporter protein (LYSE/YGGA) [Paraburkholderia phymatum STM815]